MSHLPNLPVLPDPPLHRTLVFHVAGQEDRDRWIRDMGPVRLRELRSIVWILRGRNGIYRKPDNKVAIYHSILVGAITQHIRSRRANNQKPHEYARDLLNYLGLVPPVTEEGPNDQ